MAPDHPMRAFDRGFFAYEARNPHFSPGTGAVLLFPGRPPSLQEIREQLWGRLAELPPMNCRVDGRSWRRARWRRADSVDPAQLIREHVTSELGDAINELLAERFEGPLPLWRCWLVHGYCNDEFALLYLGHHALHDALAMRRMAGMALGPAPSPNRLVPPAPERSGVWASARGLTNNMRSLVPLATPTARDDFTNRRQLSWGFIPGMELNTLAREHDVTINDVFLAALTGVLRNWPESPWQIGRTVWALVPVNTRNAAEVDQGGNRLSAFRLPLPCDQASPLRRLEVISDRTVRGLRRGHQHAERGLSAAFPKWFGQFAVGRAMSTRYAQVLTSCFPVAGGLLTLVGRPAMKIIPALILPHGHHFSVAMSVSRDHSCVAFTADSSLGTADELPTRWLQSIEELKNE
ncbi:hypothetical protein GCM10009780_57070 [Actinomadura alba]